MASPQVLKKQEQLEAGRRKLEDFRRKKAAERAKKASPLNASNNVPHEKQSSEKEQVHHIESNGVATSDEPSNVVEKSEAKESDIATTSDVSSSNNKNDAPSFLSKKNNVNSAIVEHSHFNDEKYRKDAASVDPAEHRSTNYESWNGNDNDGSSAPPPAYGINDNPLNNSYDFDKDLSYGNSGPNSVFPKNILIGNSVSPFPEGSFGSSNHQESFLSTANTTESGFGGGRKLRSSFLDSIPISKGSPSLFGAEKTSNSSSPKVSQNFRTSFTASGDGVGPVNHVMDSRHDFFSRKQNEDFAALEQHIEDLTQEKFSLQRALEASRALGDSLASENSTLTDRFNQQGSIVNQLKFDLEMLQEEIKTLQVELEAVKNEYTNARLECHAADERAKLLASEVISLEEKALRLRSTELKLERQLENYEAEISSNRKKMSSLEKDRQDLQSTIDALQEEKKLLQSKLRKVSSSGKSIDFIKTSSSKKDMSTSTEDIDTGETAQYTDLDTTTTTTTTTTEPFSSENTGAASLPADGPSSQFLLDNRLNSIEAFSSTVPTDQMRMIQNINTLIAELALEKDQLTRALSAESSQSSTLLELNKELTRKLEAQTQRLELLTAQSTANVNIPLRPLDPRIVHENTTYADEGDEVVERVLGWIMKLFPGGPRRRSGKNL